MFIRYFLELSVPRLQVVEALMLDPQTWLPEIAAGSTERGDALLVTARIVGGPPARRPVALEFGTPLYLQHKTILPMRWIPQAGGGPFPALDTDLETAGLGPARTQLAVSARLAAAPLAPGPAIDRGLLFRVAEATVKDFLDQVGDVVLASVTAA